MAQVHLAAVFSQEDIDAQTAYSSTNDSTSVLRLSKAAVDDGYDFISIPLTNNAWRTRWKKMCLTDGGKQEPEIAKLAEDWRASEGPFERSEMNITRLDEALNTIGMVSDWLELDSPDDGLRYDSEIALKQELSFASYLNLQSVILPPPRNRQNVADYARAVNACLHSTTTYLQVSIRMPIYDPRSVPKRSIAPESESNNVPLSVHARAPDGDLSTTWEMWDAIRTVCGYNPRLSLSNWFDHRPVLALRPISSARSYSSASLIRWNTVKMEYGAMLPGPPTCDFLYIQCQRLSDQMCTKMEVICRMHNMYDIWSGQPHRSLLQIKLERWRILLKPLMDNLQSGTYETFERDPVKYERYEEVSNLSGVILLTHYRVICVAGAGRGPLVTRCLQALDRNRMQGVVYVVEKNPNAFVTLQEQKEMTWGDRVNLIYGDMRKIQIPESVDILVSELLGSFGDNEASPECLDGAMRFLKAPICSPKLHNEVLLNTNKSSPETPYVVMFQSVKTLSGEGGGLR
ncbi:17274_t:CDS:2, partial [Acaulospora colombiana]